MIKSKVFPLFSTLNLLPLTFSRIFELENSTKNIKTAAFTYYRLTKKFSTYYLVLNNIISANMI